MRYAQINSSQIVTGVSQLAGTVDEPHMIPLSEQDDVQAGSTYDPATGTFTPPPPPPPEPLSRTEWLGLWTPGEQVAWEMFPDQTTDPQARAEWRVWEKWFAALDRYDLASPRMSEMAAWAVSHGLLTQARADEIMAGGG